jgi:DNA helicase II / ATP-dependent DNA helicase PcrA
MCGTDGLPMVGYFGDPMQQIYDDRAGDFSRGPLRVITKQENFRSARDIVLFLNRFRTDVAQIPSAPIEVEGSVLIRLVRAEKPGNPRNRYTIEQIDRASAQFEEAIRLWGWSDNRDAKHLFLARQMIARRMDFTRLHELFTGEFASAQAKDDYEKGVHFALAPLLQTLHPLVKAYESSDVRSCLKLLRNSSPAFDPEGANAKVPLQTMQQTAGEVLRELAMKWSTATIGDILRFARSNSLIKCGNRLMEQLDRDPRSEQFDPEKHESEKKEWLIDELFAMRTNEICTYADFIAENTPYSTQHGVKGEQYRDVVVVFDDVEAAWNDFSFGKTFLPKTTGEPTTGQKERSTKLAYVCFSRAERNLRILLFTADPESARSELLSTKLFEEEQISIIDSQIASAN